jgi:hypothetical protein
MFTGSLAAVVIVLLAVTGYTGSAAQETPNLGRPATPAEIAGWDISIPPDGTGLPPGNGTPEQGAVVPWRERRRKAERPAGRRPGHAHQQESRAYRRQLLALCNHGVRLCAPGDAIHAFAIAVVYPTKLK